MNNCCDYYIELADSKNILKILLRDIKIDNNSKEEGCILKQKLNYNENILCVINKTNSEIISFIWFGIYKNKIDLDMEEKTYIHINYSYTFKKYRNIGLNKKLRLWIESYCKKNNIKYIVSVPLTDSNSKYVLDKIGYIKINSYYLKKII